MPEQVISGAAHHQDGYSSILSTHQSALHSPFPGPIDNMQVLQSLQDLQSGYQSGNLAQGLSAGKPWPGGQGTGLAQRHLGFVSLGKLNERTQLANNELL